MLRAAGRRAIISTIANIARRRHYNVQSSETRLPTSTPPWREPARGGQDLSKRYQRLEKSLRGKEAYGKEIVELNPEANPLHQSSGASRRMRDATMFMGFVVPEEPTPPGPEECCMSGCAVCVQDLYVEALDEYKKAVDSLRSSLTTLHIPEEQWPAHIRTKSKVPEPKKDVALNAFQELERQLLERKKADAQAMADSLRQHARRKQGVLSEMQTMYEGMRWVLFSNR